MTNIKLGLSQIEIWGSSLVSTKADFAKKQNHMHVLMTSVR